MPGVGKINEFILRGLGLTTCGDVTLGNELANACKIFVNFSEAAFDYLFKTCSGMAPDNHESSQKKVLGVSYAIVPTNSTQVVMESID